MGYKKYLEKLKLKYAGFEARNYRVCPGFYKAFSIHRVNLNTGSE
jgi:hypothetical protein